jgi:hypothetical protein
MFAYDPATSQTLLFSGAANVTNVFFDDTWLWTGTTWNQIFPTTSPSSRADGAITYDSGTSQLILFGGADTQAHVDLNETWEWTGTTWSQLHPVHSPPARSETLLAYDAATSQLVLFGGENGIANFDDTWVWTGADWIRQTPSTSPAARFGATMGYDPSTSQLLLFGGVDPRTNTLLGQTWEWTGTTWNQLSPPTSPPARQFSSLTYDSSTNQFVLFGGDNGNGTDMTDTWEWTGTTWSQLSPLASPSPRTSPNVVYDAATSQLVLFGGYEGGSLNDTWIYAPTQSPQVTSATSATLTVGSAGAFAVTTSGFPAPSLTETGPLPIGVSFFDNHDGTGTLGGMAGTGVGGNYPLTIVASNGVAPDASQSFTLTVNEAPSITSANGATFVVGATGTFTVTTSAYPVSSIAEGGVLPAGVSFVDNHDGTATLTGTPQAGTAGQYPLTITVSNGTSPDANQSFTFTVNDSPTLTPTPSPSPTPTPSRTPTASPTLSLTATFSATATSISSDTPTATMTPTPSNTPTSKSISVTVVPQAYLPVVLSGPRGTNGW